MAHTLKQMSVARTFDRPPEDNLFPLSAAMLGVTAAMALLFAGWIWLAKEAPPPQEAPGMFSPSAHVPSPTPKSRDFHQEPLVRQERFEDLSGGIVIDK